MAEEFVISDKIRALAKAEGLPDPEIEVKKFLDYHEMTGWKMKNGLKIVNKEVAFRNWLRNAKRFRDEKAQRAPASMPQPNPAAPLGERLDDNKIAEGLELIRKLTRKFSAGGPK